MNINYEDIGYDLEYNNGFQITTSHKPKQIWKKDDDAFEAKASVVYIDNRGIEYSYDDLSRYFVNDDDVCALYSILSGDSPEKEMDADWHFSKCKRCGHWIYTENVGLFHRDEPICGRCTPIRTNGIINLWKDPYDDDRRMYAKTKAKFEPGISVLVGCNGIGKSTLLSNIRSELKGKGVPFISFDNLGDEGGQKSGHDMLSSALLGIKPDPDMAEFATLENSITQVFFMSEGEKIRTALIQFTNKIAAEIRRYAGYGEIWIMFDALDSGLSYDVICDIKQYIFNGILDLVSDEMQVYIILSCNSYEMLEGNRAFLIEKMRYANIKSYEAFKKAILSSVEYKRKRDEVFDVKAEIWNRDYSFSFDEEVAERFNNERHTSYLPEVECASMTIGKYTMVMNVFRKNYSTNKEYKLYETTGNDRKRIPLRYSVGERHGGIRKPEVEEAMHDAICRRIFTDIKRK